ncbi:hypothetical protein QYF36_024332 [Acer negundo]|nr:hypothetical protein QYF36_024332 [Acer negundo]
MGESFKVGRFTRDSFSLKDLWDCVLYEILVDEEHNDGPQVLDVEDDDNELDGLSDVNEDNISQEVVSMKGRNIGVYGPDHTLHRAKRFALKIGDEKSYNKLYRHGGIIIERNPGSNAKLSMISYHLLLTLMQNTCHCGIWVVSSVPCKHAMACITRIRQNVEDYMHEYIKKPAYLKIYSNSIHAIPDESLWPEVEHGTVLPPLRRRRSSRPRLSRRRGITEPSRVKSLEDHPLHLQLQKGGNSYKRKIYQSSTAGASASTFVPTSRTTHYALIVANVATTNASQDNKGLLVFIKSRRDFKLSTCRECILDISKSHA